ncbi:zinc ribbon domain-containing protein [Nostoc sp.]|uniref:zinc ribbon domain-containing protein n=1 Tax=Nostoc sp. TaxID=1180 RepID=UPI003FA52EAB
MKLLDYVAGNSSLPLKLACGFLGYEIAQIPLHHCTRTNTCPHCGHIQDRDWNAARNILEKGLSTAGHVGTNIMSA